MTLKAAHFPFNESTFSLSQIPTVQSRFEAVRLHKREIQGCNCQRSLMRPQELGVKHGKSSDSVAMVFEKWPAGWADGEDEERENNKIVQRKDHRVYSTEHLAHQKHLKPFHSSSFSKTWRKKRIFLVWVQKLDINTSTKKKTSSSLRIKVILHVKRQQQKTLS